VSKFSALASLSGRRPAESVESKLPLDSIGERVLDDTRALNEDHVNELAESIAALGLIEPLVVDAKQRLLAGAHRKAAILLLQRSQPEVFDERFPDGVPIYRIDFDSETEPERALAIEAAENEKRRDYTPAEIRVIADKLRSAGYEDVKGRPKQGQKPLMPALSVVVGKSKRHLRRQLSDAQTDPEKSGTHVRLFDDADPLARQCKAIAGQLRQLKPEKLADGKRKRIENLLNSLQKELEVD
jgi:ParB family chromosome partitioning protein